MHSRGKSTSRNSYTKILLKLLKPNEIFPLKSQQHLQDEFLRNGTRNQPLKLEPLYHKAFQGEDINIEAHWRFKCCRRELELDEKNIKGIFYKLFAAWWNSTIGKWNGSHALIHQGRS